MKTIINLRVISGAIIIGFITFLFLLVMLWMNRSTSHEPSYATAIFNVVQVPSGTLTPSITVTPSVGTNADDVEIIDSSKEKITRNDLVQVSGTGGDGLRLRDSPGLDGQVLILGDEAEVFEVTDGPLNRDGYTWWYLVGVFDENRYGWSVSDYLKLIEDR